MDELYQEQILDYAKNPRNKKVMEDYSLWAIGNNPSCGDSAKLFVKLDENNKIVDASFTGEGCAISTAGVSMLTEKLRGMTMAEARKIMPGDIYNMLGINISPSRVNCALLSYRALEQLLLEYDKINKK